ncbi:hypothetical protein AHAS_Ahas02G0132300 [Arachis hypogaea]
MPHRVWNCSQAGALVAWVLQGDSPVLGKALSSDKIVEPCCAPLIPGMEGIKRAALDAGAFGCTISGAGPTAVAVIDDERSAYQWQLDLNSYATVAAIAMVCYEPSFIFSSSRWYFPYHKEKDCTFAVLYTPNMFIILVFAFVSLHCWR